jgi:hypothetical protein
MQILLHVNKKKMSKVELVNLYQRGKKEYFLQGKHVFDLFP